MTTPSDQGNRTFVGSVVFVDIVGYSRKSVSEQIKMKDRFTSLLADSLKEIAAEQRIVLDTGDGAAISFLGDLEDALIVSMHMRDALRAQFEAAVDHAENALAVTEQILLRIGINLGPIKLVRDSNGQPNIVGDGINVAQRIMSFGRPGQIVCSRSYYEVVSVISEDYKKIFRYEGSRTDKHVREHEIYVVGESVPAFNKASIGTANRTVAATKANANARSAARAARGASNTVATEESAPFLARNKKLAIAGVTVAAIVGVLALALHWQRKPSAPSETLATSKAARTTPAVVTPNTQVPGDSTTTKDATANINLDAANAPKVDTPADAPKADGAQASTQAVGQPTTPITTAPITTLPATSAASGAATTAANGNGNSNSAGTSASAGVGAGTSTSERKPATKSGPTKAGANFATVNFVIQPWGEVVINGRVIGVTPPVRQHRLPPGKYKIEIRNSTFTPYVSNVDLKAREEIAIRHKFQ